MKTKIKLLFAVSLCLISSVIFAQPVSIQTAVTIAEHHLASVSQSTLKSKSLSGSSFRFTSVKATVENNDTLYYILNDTINQGFVIVSADQRAWPILGYSTTGSFDEENQPEAFTAWMENRKKEIEHIRKNNIQANSAIKERWQNFNLKSSTIETKSVEPLIKTQWDQGCYYNAMCPADAAGSCGHASVGCTITAMAQIMKYWNYPTKGVGSHSYEHPTYGNLSADFGSTTYQWSQMPNSVTSPNDAVATLLYHCGVSLDAEYGPDASGAWDPRDELVQYFDYSSGALFLGRDGFSTSDWTNLLKAELDLGHPIWCMGGITVSHSFICDGYQDSNFFHFNWGWGGNSDGYFYMENLNPNGYLFNDDLYALLFLVPGNLPDGYTGFFLSANDLDITTKGGTSSVDICSSTNWTATSDQSWISLSTNKGSSGKTTITFKADENSTGRDRTAIVTISAEGFSDQKITVKQLASIEVTPGNLYSIISENATSITKLTLTGSIDARDFKTMRDAMRRLTFVDLSEVTIVAYTGYEGPANGLCAYPANEIPCNAFYIIPCRGHNFLKSITLPTTITSIGMQAFGNSKYLTTIDISSLVTSIAFRAFEECAAFINVDSNNLNYSSVDGVLFNKNQTTIIHCPVSKTGNYLIPASVYSIEPRAFWGCTKLASVTIPPSVNSIGDFAFWECEGLTNVNIPPSITSIGECAFWKCTSLANINIPSSVTSIEDAAFAASSGLVNVDAGNSKYSSVDGNLFNKAQTELIHCPTSINGSYIIPSSVTSIGNSAFYNCYGLTSMDIPLSVISIGSNAFTECNNLISVTIPSSIIYIGSQTFWGCARLKSIYSYNTSPQSLINSSNVFNLVNKNTCTLYVPFGCKTQYGTSIQWEDFVNIVEMPGIFFSKNSLGIDPKGGIAQVAISSNTGWSATSDQAWLSANPSEGLAGCDTITFTAPANTNFATRTASVTISAKDVEPQTITVSQFGKVEVTEGKLKTILAGQLSSITHLTLSGTIDARDFKTMRDEMPVLSDINLDDVTIAAYLGTEGTGGKWTTYYPAKGIPNYAFCMNSTKLGKAALKSISLPSSVNSIEESAFENCEGLTNINIPPSVTSIGESAFSYCFKIANINIPSSVTSIGSDAFCRINGMINVEAGNKNYSSIDGVLFNKTQTELIQCPTSKIGSYIIPSTVSSIDIGAFYFCRGLTNVTIPSSVTSIGYATFSNCDGLTSMNLPSSIISLGWYAFSECSQLTTITIPSSIITIDHGALLGCTGLRSIYIFKKSPPNLDNSSDVFGGVSKTNCTLYVPFGSKTQYATATQWKDFQNIIEMANQAPVGNAGIDQTVNGGKQVTLNGSGSTDAEGNSLTYKWTAPAEITLSSATSANPTFTAPKVSSDTVFVFSLVVNDGTVDSPADEVMITVRNINNAPVANAGIDQTVMEGGTVILDGSASFDPDGTAISYLWSAPAGVALNKSDLANPTFVVPDVSELTRFSFLLTVSDDQYTSLPDTVVITVEKKTGIDDDELISPKQVQIYPNPTTGLLTISMEDCLGQSPLVEVFNSMGQLVLKTESAVDARNIEIDMSAYSQGIYTLRISVGNKHFQQKIVKK